VHSTNMERYLSHDATTLLIVRQHYLGSRIHRKEVLVYCAGLEIRRFWLDMPEGGNFRYRGVQLSGDGRTCAIVNDGDVTLWDTHAGAIVRRFDYGEGSHLHLTQDGRSVGVQLRNTIRLFGDVGDVAVSFDRPIDAFTLSGDGKTLVVATTVPPSASDVVVVREGGAPATHVVQGKVRRMQIAGNRYLMVEQSDEICVIDLAHALRPLTLAMPQYCYGYLWAQLSDDGQWLVVRGAVRYDARARQTIHAINLDTHRRHQDLRCPPPGEKNPKSRSDRL